MLVEIQKKVNGEWMSILTVPLNELGDTFQHFTSMQPKARFKMILEEDRKCNCADCAKECTNCPLKS